MWTHNWKQPIKFLPSKLSFILRNFRFSVHHFAASTSLRQAIRYYTERGIIIPENICKLGLKLTTACNLKCTMCYQWKPEGLHHAIQPAHLRLKDCGNLFDFLDTNSCDVVLWGGEPLISPDFDAFVEELCRRGSWCHICTNGILIDKHFDVFERHSDKLAFLVSLDGPESIHDKIRGKGSFSKTVSNLKELVSKKHQGKKWLLGVECTIMPENFLAIEELLALCENIGVDWMVFNHLWIIGDHAKIEYSEFCRKYGNIKPLSVEGFDSPSNDFSYIDKVIKKCSLMKYRKSKIPVFFSPDLPLESLKKYYNGTLSSPLHYFKLGVKLDVEANGDVVPFKLFPDISLGNIYEQGIHEIIASNQYKNVAQYLLDQGLAICNSCPDFYNLGGAKRW